MNDDTSILILVEEPSMAVMLEVLLPSLGLAATQVGVQDLGSKQTLLRKLPSRLRSFRHMAGDIRVMVLLDRDDEDCRQLKERLEAMAADAGLATKSAPGADGRFQVVNRIVVEELEAWFFGDVPALRLAYPRLPGSMGTKAAFRDPDAIRGGTWEALLRALQAAGYYPGLKSLPKIEVARLVGAHMTPSANQSRSFQVFVSGLQALMA